MLKRTRYRSLGLALASVLLAVCLAACGSSNSGKSTESSTSGGKSAVASSSSESKVKEEAQKLVEKEETPPATVPEALPLKNKSIPSGKTVAFLGCGAEQCLEYYPPIKAGAEALGWHAKLYQGSVEPNKLAKYFEEIVAAKPSVFIACCVAPSLASKYFKELKEEGTISVMCCTAQAGTEDLTKLVSLPSDKLASGKAAADFMLAEKGEKLNVLYVNSKDFEVSAQYAEGLKGEISRLCAKCEVHEIQVAVENIGKPAIATEVVSYLRSHPEINYVSTLFSPLLTGVPAAMKAAGIENIGITSTASGAIALEDVKTGKEYWKAVQNFGIEWGLWGLNIALRTMLHEPLGEETATPEVLVTEKNAATVSPGAGNQPVIKNALEQYKKLWGVS